MDGPFTLTIEKSSTDRLYMHPETAAVYGIKALETRTLKFGAATRIVQVEPDPNLDRRNLLRLSESLLHSMNIPLPPRYEIVSGDREIQVGPLIGMLVSGTEQGLRRRLRFLSRYTQHYPSINGVLLAFSLSGVNRKEKQVSGFYYHPEKKNWKRVTVPYPDSIFNMITLNDRWRSHFRNSLDRCLFNEYRFSKWEMYQALKEHPETRDHLPETHLLASLCDLVPYLDSWDGIYIKPVAGSLGRSIYRIRKNGSGYSLSTSNRRGNFSIRLANEKALLKSLKKHLDPEKTYLFQPLLRICYPGGIRDFRLIVVKDETGEWKDVGLIGRLGKRGAVVSSSITGARREPGEATIQSLVAEERDADSVRKKMSELALSAARIMDRKHHYGNFGMDLAMDQDGKLWLIEINSRDPHHYKAAKAGRKDLAREACRSNLAYAKRLAGFYRPEHSTSPSNPYRQDRSHARTEGNPETISAGTDVH
ncbi:YheC/D-like protein [Melghirimyces profundicolus]|uniref:YheC/D-like protein n=1 Tax=Melghirimyces profundicolus TaxID=1242148 RepID=A0A2T6BSM9_9BACL|nr:YheC/YheD family protein [Melghirimyces profundicolus]PTX59095.1 YheC/D-like protein [Melghirimyces profundicolus]